MEKVHELDRARTVKKPQIDEMIYKIISVLRKEIPEKELHLRVICNGCMRETVVILPNQRELDEKIRQGDRIVIECKNCSRAIRIDPKSLQY